MRTHRLLPLLAALALAPGASPAAEIRVAAAANFTDTLRAVAVRFTARTGHVVVPSFASTGKHYAQIVNGAPFDVFLAADVRRPERLEREGWAVSGSRFTYAVGKLVLWSPDPDLVDPDGRVLSAGGFRHLAVANPELAPYGQAAREALTALGLWDGLASRLVRGETVGQTYQFVRSGNAELGFVALSQLQGPGRSREGSRWDVPRELYAPIEQQAVLLRDGKAARVFLSFLRGEEALRIIREYGYDTPPCSTTPISQPSRSP